VAPGLESCHALVLNADFRPLSYFPLSIWSWQDTVKAVFLDRVSVISEYDRKIHSPSFEMRLPSVIAPCNLLKGNRLLREIGMHVQRAPIEPTTQELQENGRAFPPGYLHESWRDFLYWDSELDQN
jgi:hypothetical protein